MEPRPANIAVLGSTGSIGASALAVIEASQGRLRAAALSAHSKTELALEQAIQHEPRWLIITDEDAAARQNWSALPEATELLIGHAALVELVGPQVAQQRLGCGMPASRSAAAAALAATEATVDVPSSFATAVANEEQSDRAADVPIDIVLAAIVGSAGLRSTWAAVQAGRRVAIANKETLVMAGPLVMDLAAQTGAAILPVDSEHSAVFQCLQAGRRGELRRIILTASGGPFRRHSAAEL
jgi:1-deoxy-D-xylulose-5-phosphate reductoisomerase